MNIEIAPFIVIIGISANAWNGKSFAELPEAIMNTEPEPALRQSSKWLTLKGTSGVSRAVEAFIVQILNWAFGAWR
ncbi:hypothetical protein D3C76_1279550 [compost metagenome]